MSSAAKPISITRDKVTIRSLDGPMRMRIELGTVHALDFTIEEFRDLIVAISGLEQMIKRDLDEDR